MESPSPIVTDVPSQSNEIAERPMKIYEEIYHGSKITIVELEHATKPDYSTSLRPSDWKIQIDNQINLQNDSLIFPEYCPADMWRRVFREPGFNRIALDMFQENGTLDHYSHISRLAGAQERPLFAADIANTTWYEFYNQVVFANTLKKMDKYVHPDKIFDEARGIKHPHDARHLILARGIMQEVLRQQKPILHINAPTHSINIDDVIKKQIEWESASGIKITQPVDFRYASPELENEKMKIYSKLFPLNISVREYHPVLPTLAYEIDQIANEFEPSSKSNLLEKITLFLETKPKEWNQRVIAANIKEFGEVLKKTEDEKVIRRKAGIILTDKYGWRLKRTEKVY